MTTQSNHHLTRRLGQLLAIAVTALALLVSVAPRADAQQRATLSCPERWVLGPFGCQPDFITIEEPTIVDITCPKGWVFGINGCQANTYTAAPTRSTPTRCPEGWTPSSAPGGCSPTRYTLAIGGNAVHASYGCAFGSACKPMVDAIKALGGSCVTDGPDVTCELPPLLPDRD